MKLSTAVALGLTGAILSCSVDHGKLDQLRCSRDAVCRPDQHCEGGFCHQDACEEDLDCGLDYSFVCDRGYCEAQECDPELECSAGFECATNGFCRAVCVTDEDCDDELDCTADFCVRGSGCHNDPAAGTCAIDGSCWAEGATEPSNTCRECDTAVSQRAWTNHDENECDDDNPCSYADACEGGICSAVPYSCDDGLPCTEDTCDGLGDCGHDRDPASCIIDNVCYERGQAKPDNDCLECQPLVDATRWTIDDTNACDDANPCSYGDSCVSGTCTATPYSCSDGLDCTEDLCDGLGGCDFPLDDNACVIAGECRDHGDPNSANGCEECRPEVAVDRWSADDTNVPRDLFACTIDTCNGGVEVHTPDDNACGQGQVCAPCAGGCVAVPSLSISCPADPAEPGQDASCLVYTGRVREAACLRCSTLVGTTTLFQDTFAGCPSLPSLGWTVQGDEPPTCPSGGELGPDPDVEEDILHIYYAYSFWRTINTTGFDSVRLCFDYAETWTYAEGGYFEVAVDTDGGFDTIWSSPDVASNGWLVVCLDLTQSDPNAADNTRLGVRLQKPSSGGIVYVDNVRVVAWSSDNVTQSLLSFESFDDCALGDWSSEDNAMACPIVGGSYNGRDAIEVTDANVSISQTFNVATICDDLRMGFTYETANTDPSTRLRVLLDHGDGSTLMWGNAGPSPANGDFAPVVIDLRPIDPASRLGHSVETTIEIAAPDSSVYIDDLWVEGALCGDGLGLLSVGPAVDVGGGDYSVSVSSPTQVTAYLECQWDGRSQAAGRIQFLE